MAEELEALKNPLRKEVSLFPERLPFEQAQKYWAGKFPVSYEEYLEMSEDAKSLAFSAAGYGTAENLATVYDAVGRAIADGIGFDEFQQDILAVILDTDWSRKHQELIYHNGIQSAYAAGRYERQQQVKAFFPYLVYDAVDDNRVRPTHKAMDNRIYRIDDPVWDEWTPQNGHRCRCMTRSMSEKEFRESGAQLLEGSTGNETVTIEKEGETVQVPLKPDAGFAVNQAKTAWKPDLEKIPKPLAKEYLKRLEAWEKK